MFSPKFLVNANEASKNVDVINENFRNIKIDLEYLNDLDKRISDIDARTKCVNPERIRRDYLLTKSELDGKLYGSISDGRIPQKDHLNSNKLKDTSWEAYYEHLQPVNDNESDIGQSLKRVKTAYAYVVNALTGIYRAGIELASVFAPISHASNSTTYGIADASNYGHVKSSTVNPLMDGTADPGTAGALVANYNHRHPTDTSREAAWERATVTASSNLDNYTIPGTYVVSNAAAATNMPSGAYGFGVLQVLPFSTGSLVQMYFPHRAANNSASGIWMRVSYTGTWQNWQHVYGDAYNETKYAPLANPTLTGVTKLSGALDAQGRVVLSGVIGNTNDANIDLTGNTTASGFINLATLTANRTLILPNPSLGRIFSVSNVGSSTAYGLLVNPSSGSTIHYGITPILTGGNIGGVKSMILQGASSTNWAVVSMWTL